MHAKFEGENLKIERAVSILVKWVSIMWSNLKSKEKRSGLKPPFKELSHGKLSMRKQQNLLSWLVIYKNKRQTTPYRCIIQSYFIH